MDSNVSRRDFLKTTFGVILSAAAANPISDVVTSAVAHTAAPSIQTEEMMGYVSSYTHIMRDADKALQLLVDVAGNKASIDPFKIELAQQHVIAAFEETPEILEKIFADSDAAKLAMSVLEKLDVERGTFDPERMQLIQDLLQDGGKKAYEKMLGKVESAQKQVERIATESNEVGVVPSEKDWIETVHGVGARKNWERS